jgi:hypothetical protein
MVNGQNHPWMLAGPWYRWPQPGVPSSGRTSAPILQKYETGDFVNEFLKDPQHSLVFLENEDRVFETTPRVPPLPLLSGKISSLFASAVAAPGGAADNVVQSTGIRKLFLDMQKRFYLVVCELHCDVAGFPQVDRGEVCEAGFVIRRRYVQIPKTAEKPLRKIIRERGSAAKIQSAAEELGVFAELQGWIPSSFDRIGSWQKVEETPAINNTEKIQPLYPLVPDPRLAQHAGKGRTIYFGVVPTCSADTDELGNARFDDRNLYEIRCYVRRHKPPCPKLLTPNDCHGPLTWSQRTEQFQIASHFDLAGSSNRPVTIQLPDLPALQAQVAADPTIGRKAAVKMVAPKGSNLETSGQIPNLTGNPPGAAICSFSIPLITIVATFVFKLFLPIVVLVFQLWWMLALKFCIPPSFSVSAGVAAGLSATPPGVDISASLAVTVQGDLSASLGSQAAASIETSYAPRAQAEFEVNLGTDYAADLPPDVPVDPPSSAYPGSPMAQAGTLPTITANLQFLPEVTLS